MIYHSTALWLAAVFQFISSRLCSIETHVTLYRCQLTNFNIPASTFHLQTSRSITILLTSVAHMMSWNANKDVPRSKGFLRLIYSLAALGGGSVLDSEGSSVLPEDRCMADLFSVVALYDGTSSLSLCWELPARSTSLQKKYSKLLATDCAALKHMWHSIAASLQTSTYQLPLSTFKLPEVLRFCWQVLHIWCHGMQTKMFLAAKVSWALFTPWPL